MTIDGYLVTVFSEDGFPIKNALPEALQERLKTENQWIYDGYIIKNNANKYKMYAGGIVSSNHLYDYYLDDDVQEFTKFSMPKFCLTCNYQGDANCRIRQNCSKRYCNRYVSRFKFTKKNKLKKVVKNV